MMYDDLSTPEENSNGDLGYQPSRSNGSEKADRLSRRQPDREVPIPNSGGTATLHRWLDGEVSVAVLRATQGGNDAADLWTKIHDEAETLRSRTTPLYVHKRIMDSLPEDKYHGNQHWYKRPISVNPAVMIAAAAVLLSIGAFIAHMVIK